jgi:catalase
LTDHKQDGSFSYIKIHFISNQGAKNLTNDESIKLAGENPDHHAADLYNAIERGEYPSWKMCIQVMSPREAEQYRWNIFDMTKVWPHSDYPLQEVAKLTLNRNPANCFAEIEQAAFSPSTIVPGIAPSADPMLQARMFAYPDAARYRLGVNYQQLPCNKPVSQVYSPYQRDGAFRYESNYGGDPNYVRATVKAVKFEGKLGENGTVTAGHDEWVGRVSAYTSQVTDDDFVQAAALWDVLGKDGKQDNFVYNVSQHLEGAAPYVQRGSFGK